MMILPFLGGWEDRMKERSKMVCLGSDLTWYALATAPRQEGTVEEWLGRRKVDRFLPRYTKVVRRNHKRCLVRRQLFPGYVFVGFTPGLERWNVVRETPGVIGPVMHLDGAPWAIRTFDMEVMRRTSDFDVPRSSGLSRDVGIGDLMSRCARGDFDEDVRRIGAKVEFSTLKLGPILVRQTERGRIICLEESGRVRVLFGGGGTPKVEVMTLDEISLVG